MLHKSYRCHVQLACQCTAWLSMTAPSNHANYMKYTVSQKHPNLAYRTITLTHVNGFWYFFGRNVTDKVGSQKTLYFAASNNLCFCTTWQNVNTKMAFFTQMLYLCIARIQPVARCLMWFLQSCWLTTHAHAAVWLPKSSNQCAQLGAVGEHGSEERKSRALQQLDCVACTRHQCIVFRISCFKGNA